MSERHLAQWVGAVLATGLSCGMAWAQPTATEPAAPLAEAACFDLTRNFRICPAHTPWAMAQWVNFGDGSALEGDDLWLEFTESWATRREGDTLDAALDALMAEITAHAASEQFDDFQILLTDRLDTASLQVARAVYRIDLAPEPPLLIASMIAEGGGQRILLMVGHTRAVDTPQIEQTARDLAALVHPIPER